MRTILTTSESGNPLVAKSSSVSRTEGRSKRYGLMTVCLCLTLMLGIRSASAQTTTPEYIIYQEEKLASASDTYTEIEIPYYDMSNAMTYKIMAPLGVTITQNGSGNLQAGADGAIKFQVTNGTTRLPAGTYEFEMTMTGDGCPSETHIFHVIIIGKPVLNPFSGTSPVCNELSNVTATGTITATTIASITPTVKYTWTAELKTTSESSKVTFTANGGGEIAYGSGLSIAQSVVNNSDVPVEIAYTAVPIAYYGDVKVVGESKTWTVTVNPTAKLTSSGTIAEICNKTEVTYTATSNVPGATLAWKREAVAGIKEVAATGTGDISEILTNTTAAPITVTYTYTVTANSCTNATTFPVTVVVNPTPTLNSPTNIGVKCSGNEITYTPGSAVNGSSFEWSRATIEGITEPGKTGTTSTITETLHNTTKAPIVVTYVYTITANECSNSQNVTVTINPTLDLELSKSTETICSGTAVDVDITSALTGGTNKIKWTATASGEGAIISGFSDMAEADYASGLKIAQTLTNTGTKEGKVTYTVTQTFGECPVSKTYVVTVAPTLTITTVAEQIVCSEDATSTISFASNVTSPAVSYAWEFEYNPADLTVDPTGVTITDIADGKKKASGSGSFTLTKVTRADNATTPVTVNVSVTGKMAGMTGCDATTNFNVTVKPKPKFKLGKRP